MADAAKLVDLRLPYAAPGSRRYPEATLRANSQKFELEYSPYRIIRCSHSSHAQPSNVQVDTSCAAGSFLGIFFSPPVGMFVSPELSSCIPSSELQQYITDRVGPEHKIMDILDHLLAAFHILPNQQRKPLYMASLLTLVLPYPIPGLPELRIAWKCRECGVYKPAHQIHTEPEPGCKVGRGPVQLILPLFPGQISLSVAVERHPRARNPVRPPKMTKLNEEDLIAVSEQHLDLIASWQEKENHNLPGHVAPQLIMETGGAFTFSNQKFFFRCQHIGKTVAESETVYTGCSVLSFVRLFFCPMLRAAIDPVEHTVLTLALVETKLKQRKRSGNEAALRLHLLQLGLIEGSPTDIWMSTHRNITVQSPIPYLKQPSPCYRCPTCNQYVRPRHKEWLDHHMSHHTALVKESGVHLAKLCFSQQMWSKTGDGSSKIRLFLPAGWRPNPPVIRKPPFFFGTYPQFLQQTGYREELESWQLTSDAHRILIQLTTLPSQSAYLEEAEKELPGTQVGNEFRRFFRNVEAAVKMTHTCMGIYLGDAEHRLEGYHETVRKVGTESVRFFLLFRPFLMASQEAFKLVLLPHDQSAK